jgi:HSP90 family molecular chaperone
MVADRVDVISRKAGEDAAWKWSSDGKGGYEVTPAEREGFGTTVCSISTMKAGIRQPLADRVSREEILQPYPLSYFHPLRPSDT